MNCNCFTGSKSKKGGAAKGGKSMRAGASSKGGKPKTKTTSAFPNDPDAEGYDTDHQDYCEVGMRKFVERRDYEVHNHRRCCNFLSLMVYKLSLPIYPIANRFVNKAVR